MDEMLEVVRCKYCGESEYYGEFRWKNGRELCRRCYKSEWEASTGETYKWDDLNGPFPDSPE